MTWLRERFQGLQKLIRYGVMGVAINLAGYLVYLLITWSGMEPKSAMTVVYLSGVLAGYFGHRGYSFRYQGGYGWSMLRFFGAHAVGYGMNFMLLYVLSDRLGYPHQMVQALAIVVVAYTLYILFNYVVFRQQK